VSPPSPSPRKLVVGWALRLLGPVILAILVARLDRPGEIVELLAAVAPAPLAAALVLNVAPLWLKAVRWNVILRARGIAYPAKQALVAFSSSLYLGMLTPGRVGDVLRIQYLRHDTGARYAEGLASLVVDRLADLYVLVAFVSVAVVHWGALLAPDLVLLAWLMVAASVLGPAALLVPGVADRVLGAVYRRVARGQVGQEPDGLEAFLTALREGTKKSLVPVLALTTAAFALNFAQGVLLARAMGLPLSWMDVIGLSSIQSMMGLLPISVSGLGVREAFFAGIFPAIGRTPAEGASYGLLVFAVLYVVQVVFGAIAWQVRPPPTGEGVPSQRLVAPNEPD
jgi:uncharacterized protein (TIRG00374 family)